MVLLTTFTQLIKLTISQKLKGLRDKLQDHLIMWSKLQIQTKQLLMEAD